MEKRGKETYVLEHLRPYFIHSPGIRNVLEALRFKISDLEYRLILRKLQKQDWVSGWNILLDAIKRSPTSEAFTEFQRIVHCDEIFLHIKEVFESRCKEIGYNKVVPSEPMRRKKTAELGLQHHHDGSAIMFQKFKELIPYWSSQKEDRAKFESQCYQHLESGYKFRYIIVSSYIDDLINEGGLTVKKLKDARAAFQYMLPYAFNLYQYTDQKEYRIIKKYTAYYMCFIKDNLKSAPEIADTIFRTMGYKAGKFPDELHLETVSRSIAEVTFELYLCDLEFERIISVVEDAELRYGMAVGTTIGIWQGLFEKNRGTWRRDKVDVFLANYMNEKGIADRFQSNEAKRMSPIGSGAIMREEVVTKKPNDSVGTHVNSSLHVPRYPGAGAVSRVQETEMKDRSTFSTDSVGMEEPADAMGMQYDLSMHVSQHPNTNTGAVSRVRDAWMEGRSSFTSDAAGREGQFSREDSEEWMYGGQSSKSGHNVIANDSVSQMSTLRENTRYVTGSSERQTWAPSTERSTGDVTYGFEGKDRTEIGQVTEFRKPFASDIYSNVPPGYGSDYSGKTYAQRADFDNLVYGSTLKIMHPPNDDELFANTGGSSTTLGDTTYGDAYSNEDLYANMGTRSTTLGDTTYGDAYSNVSGTASSKRAEDLYANIGGSSTKLTDTTYVKGHPYVSVTASSEKDEDLYANAGAGITTTGYTSNAKAPHTTAPYALITASSKVPGSQIYRSEKQIAPQFSDTSSQVDYQSQGRSGNELDRLRDGTAKLPPIGMSSTQSVDNRSMKRERSDSEKEGYGNVAVDSMTAGRSSNTSRYVNTEINRTPYENHSHGSYKKFSTGSIGGVDYTKPLASGYSDLGQQYDSSNSGLGQHYDKVDTTAQGSYTAQRPSLIDEKGISGVRDIPRNDPSEIEKIELGVAESTKRAAMLAQRTKDNLRPENVFPDVYGQSGEQFSQKYPAMSYPTSAYLSKVEREAAPVTYIGEDGRSYKTEQSGRSDRPTGQIPKLYLS